MTFEYRDPDGDIFTARPTIGTPSPAVLLHISPTPSARVPLDRVEEVVAGIRDAARQTGQQPDPTVALAHAEGEHERCGPECEPDRLRAALEEARMWARHGYEIGQRSCTWSDQGVAPAWLTDGWPIHFPGPDLTPAAGLDASQPATGQARPSPDSSSRLRQLILNCLTGRAVCGVPRPSDEATGLLDAYRAAVLREAADELEKPFGETWASRQLRYMVKKTERQAAEALADTEEGR